MSVFPPLTELRAKAQPQDVLARRNAEHWSGRLYLRHLSIHVTRLLVPTGISANGVTWLMAFIGVVGAAVLILPSWWALLARSEEHTSELQSRGHLVCRLLLEKKNNNSIHDEDYRH